MNSAHLFPTQVGLWQLGRPFTRQELDAIYVAVGASVPNGDNGMSQDHEILNNPGLAAIRQKLEECIGEYLQQVIRPRPDAGISLYITQSWLTVTEQNQSHHRHTHPNSIISGVLYIDADKARDKVRFYRTEPYQRLAIPSTQPDYEDLPVGAGDIIIFPSELSHAVPKSTSNMRVSLAFNTFIRGTLQLRRSALSILKL